MNKLSEMISDFKKGDVKRFGTTLKILQDNSNRCLCTSQLFEFPSFGQ